MKHVRVTYQSVSEIMADRQTERQTNDKPANETNDRIGDVNQTKEFS